MASEFALIARHFTRPTTHTILGGGDDCAVFAPRPGMQVLVSSDMLVAGTHFFPDTAPWALGWKAAAVNLSDIAAMGGMPRWITLALALPDADEDWIAPFAEGFAACCSAFETDWIGGDTTRGPLTLCPTVFGEIPTGEAIRRDGARVGDDIWVSGQPGRAALGLQHLLGEIALENDAREDCLAALLTPQPRVALGQALRGIAHAMLDVSDGLVGDLGHILARSGVGAVLVEDWLPIPTCANTEHARRALLAGGDDYELLFAAPPNQRDALDKLAATLELPLTLIGRFTATTGLWLETAGGHLEPLAAQGYDHFSAHREAPV